MKIDILKKQIFATIFQARFSNKIKYFISETIHAKENGSRGTHLAKFLISNFLKSLTYSALVAIESSYFSVCQHVRVQISNSSASVVALTAFVRHLPHVRPHLYLKTWCVYAREALVTFVCLLTSMCHLVFLQLMYVLVCKSYHIGQTLSNT